MTKNDGKHFVLLVSLCILYIRTWHLSKNNAQKTNLNLLVGWLKYYVKMMIEDNVDWRRYLKAGRVFEVLLLVMIEERPRDT